MPEHTKGVNEDTAALNLRWADALIDGIVATDVHHAVISPGSRSTPLVLAIERRRDITSWHHPDERSAAFFALGLASHDRKPVIVIATSGSAPAHWYPAVIEANRGNIPLLLLSADRPPELQNCGANQSVDQNRLFGSHVRGFHDPGPAAPEAFDYIRALGVRAGHQACWPNPGPVHLNLPFREPLVPKQFPELPKATAKQIPPTPSILPDKNQIESVQTCISGLPGLIVCGPNAHHPGFPDAVTKLAKALDTPILADPLSQLRFGNHDLSHIISRYDGFLRNPNFRQRHQPAWVLRFGAAPVSKILHNYLEGSDVPTLLCDPFGNWPDPLHQVTEMIRATPTLLCQKLLEMNPVSTGDNWFNDFAAQERALNNRQPAPEPLPFEDKIIAEIFNCIPSGATLFSGNSLPIRQLDSWSGTSGKTIRFLANRGASGIDGNISTLLGIAATNNEPVIGLLGDLTFFHDMNGLLAMRDSDATIILLNNGGGAIFGQLPQAELEGFEKHWLMPTGLDFSHAAQLFVIDYRRITKQAEFRPALSEAITEKHGTIIEVMIDRKQSLQRQADYWIDFNN
ncbi:MAG: 2-succinyl-5-enolpyruvyl-6-hydroxy-3-cyclohexene-1-carboxylate synthase [Gammaproteobacteria bacterium (ex Lamellibrachia satsuma)]|nr:MAG: 2-succinyl-5-enolpyruvyl-6-hydroxy-3-cyclohexene-1-carboxylic-acid synthase [Gammaproteobacteria bacterium (ex Lamellibrachia satsuma)]RRS34084.1 MAG: 2-succinyl-5-enolpyruvyl-6-hydroxy-3-cyclohexene-1-carboxylate synthase [Gammaproteobacteria bacterium (ex Lamellibrachia satsuma)]RRS35165.1 MAG: 2-succinyl-5-enolpyruvyl-6-hydroxy-3-cyclohexene-1-carboxylate synthase [Gammaproteobacteria bacterium (ex Lamellibrachia satsuma)]